MKQEEPIDLPSRHALATLAYRAAGPLPMCRKDSAKFSVARVQEPTGEILAHLRHLIELGAFIVQPYEVAPGASVTLRRAQKRYRRHQRQRNWHCYRLAAS